MAGLLVLCACQATPEPVGPIVALPLGAGDAVGLEIFQRWYDQPMQEQLPEIEIAESDWFLLPPVAQPNVVFPAPLCMPCPLWFLL
jgi:hypothetical protein